MYEEKVDGYRMLAYKDGARVRLVSRNGVDHTRRYPDVATAFAQLKPSTLVLDGELAVFDQQLRSRFKRHELLLPLAMPHVRRLMTPAWRRGFLNPWAHGEQPRHAAWPGAAAG